MSFQNTNLVDTYIYPRTAGEMNLIAEVRQALIVAGIGEKIAIFDNDPNIIFASNMNPNVQRFKLNTFLDTQYMSLRMDVSQERSMLLDSGPVENWLQMFVSFHIPALKAYNLPQSYPI